MRHWLSWVRVFDSLKNTMAVYKGLGREKRICCEVGRETLKVLRVRDWLLRLRDLAARRSRHDMLPGQAGTGRIRR